jgi:DNA-binding response OmpR family regulator
MIDPCRILIVDDEELNCELLSAMVEILGHEPDTAYDGKEALRKVDDCIDLVLLDVMMPGMTGVQVLEHLKSNERTRHIPVVMVSALSELDTIVRCIELGAEDYLPKPFNPTLLKARVSACLEKKRFRDRELLHLRQIEQERRRADELLRVILPHEIVEELKATNRVKPRLCENVAVLFGDVVEFTPYCNERDPEEVISHLQDLVVVFEELSLRHQMQKIKTSGDAFLATAGLLNPVENPVLSAVRCGLEMIAGARRLPAQWKLRVGIHVGPVIAGVVGHRQYLFDLWGDTVNTAARIESQGAHASVTVSRTAWDQVSSHCRGESLGLALLKGKGQMELFRVDGLNG